MNGIRSTFPATLVLVLIACAPGGGKEGERPPGPAQPFELAVGQSLAPVEVATVEVATSVIDLTSAELRGKIEAGEIRLIDVRTAEEFAEGMIPGAEHIALDSFDPADLGADDGREIVLYCRSGRRSGIAGDALAAHSKNPAQHLAGGIIAWEEAGFQTVRPVQ